MKPPNKFEAIVALVGGRIGGKGDGSEVNYGDGQTPPTEAEIDIKLAEMLAEWDAQEYARNRKAEYDALNQFELISDDAINGTTMHKDSIVAIKAKYPKPE
jgi:hypothetical protein